MPNCRGLLAETQTFGKNVKIRFHYHAATGHLGDTFVGDACRDREVLPANRELLIEQNRGSKIHSWSGRGVGIGHLEDCCGRLAMTASKPQNLTSGRYQANRR